MAKYFNYFPTTVYNTEDGGALQTITNLTSKFTFANEFKNNSALFYQYAITDGETPEMLAHKIYNSAERHWIILAFNDIFNPTIDWPVEQRSLSNIIDMKYTGSPYANTANGQTGLEWSQSNIHSYYKIESQKNEFSDIPVVSKVQVDVNTYSGLVDSVESYTLQDNTTITISTTKESKTYYDEEIDANEKKRIIKILKPEFVSIVETEFKKVFN
jgi:hypothetical protein